MAATVFPDHPARMGMGSVRACAFHRLWQQRHDGVETDGRDGQREEERPAGSRGSPRLGRGPPAPSTRATPRAAAGWSVS